MSKTRTTINFLKKEFQKYGLNLLTDKYVNSRTELKYKCNNGHKTKTTWGCFRQNKNKKCRICHPSKIINRKRLTIDFIKSEFEKRGYTLLEDKYIGCNIPMKYLCDKNHQNKMRWNNFRTGQKCRRCVDEKNKYSMDDVKKFLDEIDYITITEEYTDTKQKLDIVCDNDHHSQINFNKLLLGTRCKFCVHEDLRAKYEDVKKEFENHGCKLLSKKYNNCDSPLTYICKCGNISRATYYSIKQGYKCGCGKSRGEDLVVKYLKKNNIKYIPQKTFKDCRDKQILLFDFFVNKKFIIEFDGIQHFKSNNFYGGEKKFILNKKHDDIKNKYCIKNKIKLLRISFKEIKNINKILNEYITNINKQETITYSNKQIYKDMINRIK